MGGIHRYDVTLLSLESKSYVCQSNITHGAQYLTPHSPISYSFWTDFHASLNTTHLGLQNDQAIIKP